MSSREIAGALHVEHRTALRWLRAWAAHPSTGVRCVPAAGRHGRRYIAPRSLPARWRRGELPAPRL